MSGSRWFVSKSKESRRERARAHNDDERRGGGDDYVPSHRRGSDRARERSRAAHTTSSPDRKDPGARTTKNSDGSHTQLVFRRQDRVKVKQRTPEGSPRRDELKAPSTKSRNRDSKKSGKCDARVCVPDVNGSSQFYFLAYSIDFARRLLALRQWNEKKTRPL